MGFRHWLAVAVSAPAVVAAFSGDAFAFGPSVCTPGTLTTRIEPTDTWNGASTTGAHFSLPLASGSPTSIANNTAYTRYLRGSGKVSAVSFTLDVNIHSSDTLIFWGPNETQTFSGGGLMSNVTTTAFTRNAGFPGWYGSFSVNTDSSLPSVGFKIASLNVSCSPEGPAPAAFPASVHEKNVGFLTQTSDTVYYSYPPPPTDPGTGSPFHLHVALNHNAPASSQVNFDFDLYARCGALPTASAYDYVGYSGTPQEFLDITTPCTSTWFFAVNSYSGKGVFDLNIGEGGDLVKCIGFPVSAAYPTARKQQIADQIVADSRAFYGATLGGLFVNRLIFIDGDLSSTCVPYPGQAARPIDAVISDACSGSQTAPNAGQMTFAIPKNPAFCSGNQWDANRPYVFPHELGHNLFQFPDEYQPGGDVCGHSLMGFPTPLGAISLCSLYNHAKDPPGVYVDPGTNAQSTTPFGNGVSMWQKAAANYYGRHINMTVDASGNPRMMPVFTADNYAFQDFDFNSYLVHLEKVVQFN